MRQAAGSVAHAVLCGALALLVACAGAWPSHAAWGDEAVDEAQSVLDQAEQNMSAVVSECDQLTAKVQDLQARIDEAASGVLEAQSALFEGRAALGKVAVGEYRTSAAESLLSLILDAESFDELLRAIDYANRMMRYQADAIAEQKLRQQKFDELARELSAEKDAQELALADLRAKRDEAAAIVDDAAARLRDAQADEAARLEALRAQAEALASADQPDGEDADSAYDQQVPDEVLDQATTVNREEVVPDDAVVQQNPDTTAPAGGSGVSDTASGWLLGVASAYGGSTDPYTPNPGTTATGAICDDTSMGVAIPMSLPNYRSYFGRTVEISYGGMTVYAVVNDCGSMGGGSRALDLQPGVWKAFGFTSCLGWGVRTVSYRFL